MLNWTDLIRSGVITDTKGKGACIYMLSVKGFGGKQAHTGGGYVRTPLFRHTGYHSMQVYSSCSGSALACIHAIFCMLMYCNSRTKKS